jgi:DNA-binding transcriptional MerR regulator/quercetin dioxygenase-like cupin family protein
MGTEGSRARDGEPADRGVAYLIGEAAKMAGVSPTMVRVWEREGLIETRRSASGYRYFGEREISRLRRIAHLRKVERLNTEGIRRALAQDGDGQVRRPVSPEVSLGVRLRELRQTKGMTLKESSEASGLSPSFLSSLERDQTGATPATLRRLVTAYGATMSAIVRQDSPPLVQHKEPGDRRRVSMHGLVMEQLIDGQTAIDASICTVEPGTGSGGSYVHDGEELILMLEGELIVLLETGEEHALGPGDSLYYPSTIGHEWRNPGDVVAKLLWACTPATF